MDQMLHRGPPRLGGFAPFFAEIRPTSGGVIHMQGTPKQSAAGLPAYVGKTGGIRILFVEDDEYYREALGADLSERGFVVHGFANATLLLGSLDSAVEADVI